MELVNEIYRGRGEPSRRRRMRFAVATAGSLMFPFAPHLGAEVYELMTGAARVGGALAARRTRRCS